MLQSPRVREYDPSFAGTCRLDDGSTVEVSVVLDASPSPVGRPTTAERRLVKAPHGGGWHLFRALPDRRVVQLVATGTGPVGPSDVARRAGSVNRVIVWERRRTH